MEINKVLSLLTLFKEEVTKGLDKSRSSIYASKSLDSEQKLRFIDLLKNIQPLLPDHNFYLSNLINWHSDSYKEFEETLRSITYIETLIKLGLEKGNSEELRFLQGAADKLKEAGVSFDNEDYISTINNLNTATELALKDELDIPTTISRINTRKIIEVCISEGVGPVDYLKEVTKHVLEIDNKIKHQGYKPTRIDCINAITAFEEFLKKVKKFPLTTTPSIRQKIFSGI